ncbi:hypothetical protein D5S18_23345 [Nocardia panacis]|uniref:Uncharacterized protein n=1 Tax=Nocardia panacis TaxID=2340916 RepID=A0A3A4K511_9NOCA|nr:hypothetical protein D5S18_23345 [Nocardia panacis]
MLRIRTRLKVLTRMRFRLRPRSELSGRTCPARNALLRFGTALRRRTPARIGLRPLRTGLIPGILPTRLTPRTLLYLSPWCGRGFALVVAPASPPLALLLRPRAIGAFGLGGAILETALARLVGDEIVVRQVLDGGLVTDLRDLALGKPRRQHRQAVIPAAHDCTSLRLGRAGIVARALTRPPNLLDLILDSGQFTRPQSRIVGQAGRAHPTWGRFGQSASHRCECVDATTSRGGVFARSGRDR